MSLYNLLNGVNPVAFFVLPMLGHHPGDFPRFRDCFIGDEEHPEYENHIIVFTRTGGGNRESYEAQNDWIRSLPGFVTDYDDSFDCTFACWVFDPPFIWKSDFEKFVAGNAMGFSQEYIAEMKRVYPKLTEKLDEIFAAQKERTAKESNEE